ncbi:MAG: bifunctional phosphoribosyl-AMP cyclohydrolase/phosphoribosyl-ATP diphosphatase HisIE [Pseudarcicella sp.]|nr:bifunctional phosphoribosyl-AMP cyclohydrolase/phosphoribosyl-ATP diphosphatase HisIE [Pseudarcicella sp.]MBP6409939.1 bifunctional phosphoribosyl-AMP cyclohydrolase/phosphoribosyl-ATP diphosphatase HisIE [Pseudarcicella sp.]
MNFDKQTGLLPVIIQDAITNKVLMLGYMNEEAFEKTKKEQIVTFYSRSKQRLWTKGETSNNFLHVVEMLVDCDQDTILIKANPQGPTCHTGDDTCFKEKNTGKVAWLNSLKETIRERKNNPTEKSYTASLFALGTNKVAQKVGEEAVELVIEALNTNNDDLFNGEAADLLFHYIVLLEHRGVDLDEIVNVLIQRHKK